MAYARFGDGDEDVFPCLFKGFGCYSEGDETKEEEVKYPAKMRKLPKRIKKNKPLPISVESFLSNPGKRTTLTYYDATRVSVRSLKGKHLLICCFLVPLLDQLDPYTKTCRALIAAYPEWRAKNFEMVMVAKMRPGYSEDEEAFSHFFSAFPCPAVPFEDPDSRDFICKSVGLIHPDDSMATLVLNDKRVVLHKGSDDIDNFDYYGVDYFPFTDARLTALEIEDQIFKLRLDPIERESYFWSHEDAVLEVDKHILETVSPAELKPVSLAELLGCQPSRVLSKYVGSGEISVADLSRKKCVVLYLWVNGMFMRNFHSIQQQCLELGWEFEVVLVVTPVRGDLESYLDNVESTLKKHNISSWWKGPYNDRTSRRLWRLFELTLNDKLLILDTASEAWELNGRAVAKEFGIEACPFTRKGIVDKKVSALRSLTLESLLGYPKDGNSYVVRDEGSPCALSKSQLKGKNILLYLDYPDFKDRSLLELLQQSYDRIKQVHPNSEVVFIPFGKSNTSDPLPSMPWFKLHVRKAKSAIKQIFPEGEHSYATIIAFGEDGLIRSRDARQHLQVDGNIDHLFADKLREEVINDVDCTISFAGSCYLD